MRVRLSPRLGRLHLLHVHKMVRVQSLPAFDKSFRQYIRLMKSHENPTNSTPLQPVGVVNKYTVDMGHSAGCFRVWYSKQRIKTEAHLQSFCAPPQVRLSRRLVLMASKLRCTDTARQIMNGCIMCCHRQGHCFLAASVFIARLYRSIVTVSGVPVDFDVSAETQRPHQDLIGFIQKCPQRQSLCERRGLMDLVAAKSR